MRRHQHPNRGISFAARCICGETTFREYLDLWMRAGEPPLTYDDLEHPRPHCDPPPHRSEASREEVGRRVESDDPPRPYEFGPLIMSQPEPRIEPEPFQPGGGTFGGGGASESWSSSDSDTSTDSPVMDDSASTGSSDPA